MSSITQGRRTSLKEHSYSIKPQQWLQKQTSFLVNMDLFVSPWTWWICRVPGTVKCVLKTCQRLMSLPDEKITSCVNSCLCLWQLPWGLEGGNSLPNDGTIPLHFVPPSPPQPAHCGWLPSYTHHHTHHKAPLSVMWVNKILMLIPCLRFWMCSRMVEWICIGQNATTFLMPRSFRCWSVMVRIKWVSYSR